MLTKYYPSQRSITQGLSGRSLKIAFYNRVRIQRVLPSQPPGALGNINAKAGHLHLVLFKWNDVPDKMK